MSIRWVTMTVFDWQVVNNAHSHVLVRDYLLLLLLCQFHFYFHIALSTSVYSQHSHRGCSQFPCRFSNDARTQCQASHLYVININTFMFVIEIAHDKCCTSHNNRVLLLSNALILKLMTRPIVCTRTNRFLTSERTSEGNIFKLKLTLHPTWIEFNNSLIYEQQQHVSVRCACS